MLVDRGDLAVNDQNQSQYLHNVPKIDKRLLKPGSYKNPKNLCFCLFCSVFMYCRRKVSAVKIGDGVVFISSKSQKRESQMMASIRDCLCISYDQKKIHNTTFSNMPGSTERQASQDDLMDKRATCKAVSYSSLTSTGSSPSWLSSSMAAWCTKLRGRAFRSARSLSISSFL